MCLYYKKGKTVYFLKKITSGQEEQRCGWKLDIFEQLYLVNLTYLVNLLYNYRTERNLRTNPSN